jgi:carbon-monoxide dehydrogenase catalytic subunit
MNGARQTENFFSPSARLKPRYKLWKKQGVLPRNIDREIVEIMHRTHIGVDQDYKNLMKQGTRAAIADGWGGSMLATELQDILFGTPYPLASEANLGVMKEDMVNLVIHGHEPVLSEMIVAVAQMKEMHDYAVSKGAKGIQLSGICCTANEILQRHGVPLCGTFLQQELAIITGACDAMVVDIQCIFQNLANVAKCFHTKLITTHPIARMEQDNVIHIEFDEHHAIEDAERIVKMAIDNFENRKGRGHDSEAKISHGGRFRRRIHRVPSGRHLSRVLLHAQRQHYQRPHPGHWRGRRMQQCPY